ncbi:hypothetical protein, partial [Burkholderia pseudomallei]|uniref:hypothetical protein n=1 Tax=Burkholderia pseudomallei TaxID=28450 RepID=UPI001F45ADAC
MSDVRAAPSIEFPARVRRIGERLHFALRIVALHRGVVPAGFVPRSLCWCASSRRASARARSA